MLAKKGYVAKTSQQNSRLFHIPVAAFYNVQIESTVVD
jgi:hypothetical protein